MNTTSEQRCIQSASLRPGTHSFFFWTHRILNEGSNKRISVYTFCLINICLSLFDDANKIKTLNIERA